MSKITYTDKVALNVNSDIADINKVNATDMNEIKEVVNENETKILLAVSSSAPATCSTGDMYFNTTNNLIYTATATNTWGTTGVAPTSNTIYIVLSTNSTYAYDGNTLVSVGGGQVENSYSTSQTNAYSCDYLNDCETYSTSEVKTNKVWINGEPIYRKVVNGTLPTVDPGSTTADANIAHGISNLGTVISISGKLTYANAPFYFPILSSNGKITCIRTVDNTNIIIRSSDGWQAGPPLQFIIEYTKTS